MSKSWSLEPGIERARQVLYNNASPTGSHSSLVETQKRLALSRMVITVPTDQKHTGLRPINANRDIPGIVELLRRVFGESLDGEERQVFGDTTARPDFLMRFDPSASRLSGGFVWEADGRIVGNVTLLPTKIWGRFLIANVAVHPSYRGQGIARALMNAATRAVQERHGYAILLQVVKGNLPAISLYQSLGYIELGNMNTWTASATRLRQLSKTGVEPAVDIRPLSGRLWREAFELDTSRVPADLNWPEPLQPDAYRSGVIRRLSDFFSGRQREVWVTADAGGQLAGLASITSEVGHANLVSVRVRSDCVGTLERPLLGKVVRRLAYIPRRVVRIDHPEDDLPMNEQLQEANFTIQRTLTHMRLDVTRLRG
jgi:ribosomal protein S18 acetylase RimI-like enzyme